MIVKKMGFEVVQAEDGRTALEILNTDQSFDLILCDVQLPEIRGFTLKCK